MANFWEEVKRVISFSPIGVGEAEKKARTAGKVAAFQQLTAREDALREQAGIAKTARESRRERRRDIARSQTIFTSPLGIGGQAETVRQVLTGR